MPRNLLSLHTPAVRFSPLRFAALLVAALAFVASATSTLAAQALPLAEVHAADDFSAAIAEARIAVREIMMEANIPGASVAVGIGDDLVWSEGFGWADIEAGVPVTALTKFRIGSVSKTVTASAIGLLMERGQLDLDAPVQQYVPAFPAKRWPITVRQVAGHIAGIRHYRGRENFSTRRYPDVTSGLEIFAADSLLFEPGTDYSYSSYGWNLISAVIEGASGEEFLPFMRDEVFEPLGMLHTVPDHTDSIIPQRVSFYENGAGGAVVNAPYVDNSYKWAGGGFLSTPEDLIRFGQAHMEAGFLQQSTLDELKRPQTLRSGESTNYGVAWRTTIQADGDATIGHSGGSVGGTTLFITVPAHDMVVAGVVNVTGPAGDIVNRVAEIFERHARER